MEGAGKKIWGYDSTNDLWLPIEVDENGYLKVDMSNINIADLADGANVVLKTLFNANTILAANIDNTPAALAIAASRIVGRLAAGNIKGCTISEVLNLLLTTQDDIIVRGAANPARLNIASSRLVGKLAAGNIKGCTISEVLNLLLTTQGDIIKRGAANPERLAKGGVNDVLAMTGSDPAWENFQRVLGRTMGGTIYNSFRDLARFTQTVTGSGAGSILTLTRYQLSTGVTNNSICRLTSDDTFYIHQGAAAGTFELTTGFNIRTADWAGQQVWIGFMVTPGIPSLTQNHVAFYIDTNGDLYASCGNGVTGTQIDTGVNIVQWLGGAMTIAYGSTGVDFYIDGEILATITTNVPSAQSVYMNFFIQTLEAVTKTIWINAWGLRGTI